MFNDHKYLWFTDTHLDNSFLLQKYFFFKEIKKENPKGIFLTGDISTGKKVVKDLESLAKHIDCPIYFILGNHDYYHSSFCQKHNEIKALCRKYTNLHWLTQHNCFPLTEESCVLGTEGWYDCHFGEPEFTRFTFDWFMIDELYSLPTHQDRIEYFKYLAEESCQIIERQLTFALENYKTIYLLTHFPPWAEATRDIGTLLEPFWLPYNVNYRLGKKIEQLMSGRKKKKLICLAGHTHTSNMVHVSRNIECIVHEASYTRPSKSEQRIFIR